MNMRDHPTLHLVTNSSKWTTLLLLFCISNIWYKNNWTKYV